MDYDQTTMPENYDRGRRQPPGVLEMWLERVAAALDGRTVSTIVDLGCGTGRFSEGLAKRFGATVIGVDPSEKMLAQARAKPVSAPVTFVKGSAEAIPCADATVDLVFSSMAFHHFAAPGAAAQECHRVLRPAGAVCIRNSLCELGSPYERYFPNYQATLDKLPSADEIVAPFVRTGFRLISQGAVAHKMANNLDDLVEKARFRADTTLQRLSDADFAAGLNNMRVAARTLNQPVMIDIGLFFFERGQ